MTPVEKIFEMLEENDISNLAEMKEWFLMEEQEATKEFSLNFVKWLMLNCDLRPHFAWTYRGEEYRNKELLEMFKKEKEEFKKYL